MVTSQDVIKCLSAITGTPEHELDAQTAIYGSGLVSSLMMLELMAGIEKTYRIYIRPEELIEDNFANVASLGDFIERKMREARHG